MTRLEQDIKQFADERWPSRDVAGRLRKLGEEIGELAEAVAHYEYNRAINKCGELAVWNVRLEAADVGIVLTDLLAVLDGSSLQEMMLVKMAMNKDRPAKAEVQS